MDHKDDTKPGKLPVTSLTIKLAKIILRALAVILIGFVSAIIGLILGAIVGGTLAGIFEIVFGYEFVFNGRVGYKGTGQIGFILGALIGIFASGVYFFGRRTEKNR
jgi:hypothetical protein